MPPGASNIIFVIGSCIGIMPVSKRTVATHIELDPDIGGVSSKRRVQGDFNRIKSYVENFTKSSKRGGMLTGGYRTYDWNKVRGMTVYLEPITLKPYTINLLEKGKFED